MRVGFITVLAAISATPASAMSLPGVFVPLDALSSLLDTLMQPEHAIWGTALAGLLITGSAMRRRRRMPQATD